MKKSSILFACALIASTSMLLSGCGSSTADNSKVQLRFATWDVAEDVDRQQQLVDKFNSENKDVHVTLEAYGKDFDAKISAGMGSHDAPDVMYMWNYPGYANGLEPLDSYIKKEGKSYKDAFYPTLWNYNSYDGKTLGLPVGFTTHALYYNKDIFKKAGVEEPTNNWTWDDVRSASKRILKKTGVKGFAYQMKPDPYDFEMYLWSNGAKYTDKNGNLKGNVNSDKALEAFKLFQDMGKEGIAVATESNGTDEFRSGNVAMFVYGAWALNTFDKDGLNYGIVNIPSFDHAKKKPVSILSSSGVAMSKNSKHKDLAWKFMKFWTNDEANKSRIGTELPVRISVVKSEGMNKKPHYRPFYDMLQLSDGFTPASFIVKDWSKKSDQLSLAFEKMYNPSSSVSPKDALSEVLK